MSHFNEDRPEFEGFNKFYFDRIFPFLNSREFDRKRNVKKAIGAATAIGAAGIVAAILAFMRTKTPGLSIIISVGSVILAGIVATGLLKKLKSQTKEFLMSNICEFVGWNYFAELPMPPSLDIWLENSMLPGYDRVKFEDGMTGNAHSADFKFCEAHMEKEKRDSDGDRKWVTVFRGILLEVDFHREFYGRTVVLRDAGFFNRKLVDPKFEKIFEAYGTDQVEARYLLTPDFMQRLVDLESQVQGKKSRFGFIDGRLYVAIEAPNQFEAGSMFKPMVDTERTQKILGEIGAIYDVIDGVLKPLKARAPGQI